MDLLDSPYFELVEFHRGVALRARRYAQDLRLRNYDAIHLASAVEGRAEVLMTDDRGFPIETVIEGVWIDRPYEPGEMALFPNPN